MWRGPKGTPPVYRNPVLFALKCYLTGPSFWMKSREGVPGPAERQFKVTASVFGRESGWLLLLARWPDGSEQPEERMYDTTLAQRGLADPSLEYPL